MKRLLLFGLMTALLPVSMMAQQRKGNFQKGDYGYLYCHMNDRSRAWTAYALSRDGFHFHDLLNGDSIFSDHEVARIEGATRYLQETRWQRLSDGGNGHECWTF